MDHQSQQIQAVSLSKYIAGPVDCLKMDIEGAEEGVLEDLVESKAIDQVKQIILEYHHHITPTEDRLGYFLSLLEQSRFGYQIKARLDTPFPKREEQSILLGAYRKETT